MSEVIAEPAPLWGVGLNSRQLDAVNHDGAALLVVAAAGTGKTRTLVSRLARLVCDGTPPERIMLVTFSRRAAEEMIRRVGSLSDHFVAARIVAGTFHAVAQRLLRAHGSAVGLDDGWSVLDAGDSVELMGLVRAEARTAQAAEPARRRFPKAQTLAAIYSRVVNSGVALNAVVEEHYPWCSDDVAGIAAIFGGYTARKRTGQLLDFDDLLLFWRAAMAHPTLGPALAKSFDHVLVDEYQDTNSIQADILSGLCGAGAAVTAVGDDAQAIYGFRAATVRNLLGFADRFAGAATVVLEQNYRSTQPTLDLANGVLSAMTEGFAKRLWTTREGGRRPVLATCSDEAAQVDAVCDVILEQLERGVALHDQVVLARAAHHSDLLELELRRRHIPFVKFGGLRFVDAAHVKDLAACLRILENPRDEIAWPRVLGLLDGVGPATTARLLDELGVRPRRDGPDPLSVFLGSEAPRLRAVADELAGLVVGLRDCREHLIDGPAQLERIGLAIAPLIKRRYDNSEARLADFAVLATSLPSGMSRSALLAELALDPPVSTGELAGTPSLDDDWLTLSTVHSAKGGEWRIVHLIHAADGMFPSDLATGSAAGIDEERRLFYVALTRAKDQLFIYAPLRYHHGGALGRGDRHGWAQRSRFLPPQLDALLEQRAVRSSPAITSVGGEHETIAGGVEEFLGSLW